MVKTMTDEEQKQEELKKKLKKLKIEIEVDFIKDMTRICSALPTINTLSILMEAIGVLVVKLINEGMEAKKAYDLVFDYLESTIKNYAVKEKKESN